MLKISFKASAVILSLLSLSSFAAAEKLPAQSSDFKTNYNLALTDSKAKPETALCSATAHDLTQNKKYRYDRFGFTQADYDAVVMKHTGTKGTVNVQLKGEARLRKGSTEWDKVTVDCVVGSNKVQSISVTAHK